MAHVVELSRVGNDYVDNVNDPSFPEDAQCVQIGGTDLESGIPTFDANDVDHQLETSNSQRLVSKCVIILASYNPLPLLRLALVRAHTRDPEKLPSGSPRKRLTALDLARIQSDTLGALERQDVDPSHVLRRDMIVSGLPVSIQREFRQRVLLTLLLYIGAVTVAVSASLFLIPWASVQSLVAQSPYLLPVAQAGVFAVCILSLWLVYALRFEFPINLAALGFLTFGEIACAVAFGVTHGPHDVVLSLSLLLCGVLLLRAFASRAAADNEELLSPALSTMLAVIVLALVSLPLNALLGESTTHTSTIALFGILGYVLLALLWIALVLTVLTRTNTPEEHSSALVFFQADLIVLAIVEPAHVALKYIRWCKKSVQQWRRSREDESSASTSKSPHNVVVPAFWPDRKETQTINATAAVTTRMTLNEIPLYPTHLIPCRARTISRAGQHDIHDTIDVVTPVHSPSRPDGSLNRSDPGPRRRNSTANE